MEKELTEKQNYLKSELEVQEKNISEMFFTIGRVETELNILKKEAQKELEIYNIRSRAFQEELKINEDEL